MGEQQILEIVKILGTETYVSEYEDGIVLHHEIILSNKDTSHKLKISNCSISNGKRNIYFYSILKGYWNILNYLIDMYPKQSSDMINLEEIDLVFYHIIINQSDDNNTLILILMTLRKILDFKDISFKSCTNIYNVPGYRIEYYCSIFYVLYKLHKFKSRGMESLINEYIRYIIYNEKLMKIKSDEKHTANEILIIMGILKGLHVNYYKHDIDDEDYYISILELCLDVSRIDDIMNFVNDIKDKDEYNFYRNELINYVNQKYASHIFCCFVLLSDDYYKILY